MRSKRFGLEVVAWSIGLLSLTALLTFRVEAGKAEQAAMRVHSEPGDAPALQRAGTAPQGEDLSNFDGVIGRLDLPALGLHVPILNNYDPNSLRKGVGRVRGTAVPGGLGNFVVAGHRDTFFRPLRHIAKGMTMQVTTKEGSFAYVVDATSIVDPSDVDVLDIGERPEMTLITCYPFEYIGAAPKRFIVRAYLVSVLATP